MVLRARDLLVREGVFEGGNGGEEGAVGVGGAADEGGVAVEVLEAGFVEGEVGFSEGEEVGWSRGCKGAEGEVEGRGEGGGWGVDWVEEGGWGGRRFIIRLGRV